GGVDIRDLTAYPPTDKLDDTTRGRGLQNVRDGSWPYRTVVPSDRPAASPELLKPEEVYGFTVNASGEVSLPKVELILQRVDRIPDPHTLLAECVIENINGRNARLRLDSFLQAT